MHNHGSETHKTILMIGYFYRKERAEVVGRLVVACTKRAKAIMQLS